MQELCADIIGLGYYQLVLDKLTSNSVDGARLVCGDKDWKWVTKLGDIGEEPEDKLISEAQGQDGECYIFQTTFFSLC